ncbi:MAG: hypothetical protein QM692_10620 [Thermomicrobiales bacterium]
MHGVRPAPQESATQAPFWHCCETPQAVPQALQFAHSVCRLRQVPPHEVCPLGQQIPAEQISPLAQGFPQPPQCAALLAVSTQAPPQSVWLAVQTGAPGAVGVQAPP